MLRGAHSVMRHGSKNRLARPWGIVAVETFLQDLRYGVRRLLRSPGFAIAAGLTLAIGIGAKLAIFAIIDTVLLRPLANPDPDRIVQLE
jgi:putative ABC transport system permease protein